MLPEEGQWGGGTTGDQTMLVLQISPLDSQTTDQVPVERVKTLRIIIINTDDESKVSIIECNRLIEDLPTTIASQLSYTLIWPTYEGKKDIYVIANEKSIVDENNKLTLDIAETSNATDFKEEIQDYFFEPTYKIDEKDNSIYLPYTYYKDDLETKKNEVTNVAAYLVPVATKFIFNFTNKRDAAVQVNSISLEAVNSQNYLFAKVNEPDINKTLSLPNDVEKEYYWVDWLAKVSELSHGYPGASLNQSFNEQYGWITEYDIPKEDKLDTYFFVDSQNSFAVEGKDKGTNGGNMVTAGPFYIPESKYIPYKEEDTNDNNGTTSTDDENSPQEQQQEYYLTMKLKDEDTDKQAPEFKGVAIPNLKALFRNTYVIINVNMSQGDVEIYAEIAPWHEKSAKGWVEEGKDNDPKPMSVVRKH